MLLRHAFLMSTRAFTCAFVIATTSCTDTSPEEDPLETGPTDGGSENQRPDAPELHDATGDRVADGDQTDGAESSVDALPEGPQVDVVEDRGPMADVASDASDAPGVEVSQMDAGAAGRVANADASPDVSL